MRKLPAAVDMSAPFEIFADGLPGNFFDNKILLKLWGKLQFSGVAGKNQNTVLHRHEVGCQGLKVLLLSSFSGTRGAPVSGAAAGGGVGSLTWSVATGGTG